MGPLMTIGDFARATRLTCMQQRLERTRNAVESLRGMLERPRPEIEIEHRSVPETRVIAVTDVIRLADLGFWFRRALAILQETAASAAPETLGVYGGAWTNELFADEQGEAMLYLTVNPGFDDAVVDARVTCTVLPAVELAVATHDGPDEDVPRVYAALGEHVARHEISIDAPVRETYLSGFPGIDERAVIEIGWPVFRLAH